MSNIYALTTKLLGKDFTQKALNKGLVFTVEQTNKNLLVSSRDHYTSSTWLGVDVAMPKHVEGEQSKAIVERYINEVLSDSIDNYYWAVVRQNGDVLNGAMLHSASKTSNADIHSEKNTYMLMQISKTNLSELKVIEIFEYEVAMYLDYKAGRIYDIFMHNTNGIMLDSIPHVYNTDGVAVANYGEDMLELHIESETET